MEVSQVTLWRLITGTFGVICLLLMTTLGILMKNSHAKQNIQPTFSPGPIAELQKVSDCCSCQEKWIGYQCNCYFVSNDEKTWEESRHICASLNSRLLQLQDRNELDFMKSNHRFYWAGLSYSKEHASWLWEDGSAFSRDQFPSSLISKNQKNCAKYSPSNYFLEDSCGSRNYYICKQQLN